MTPGGMSSNDGRSEMDPEREDENERITMGATTSIGQGGND